jgi:hypothetical protein
MRRSSRSQGATKRGRNTCCSTSRRVCLADRISGPLESCAHARQPTVGQSRADPSSSFRARSSSSSTMAAAEVIYVVGEFYWRVAVGETCTVDDYVCPPRMLSREVTAKEANWSQAEYLEPADEICTAFGVKAPPPRQIGVYANQPNPLLETHRRLAACSGNWRWRRPCRAARFRAVLSHRSRSSSSASCSRHRTKRRR